MFTREIVKTTPALQNASPGVRLISAISELFTDTLPALPPRKGKRLDSRWGEFGILAALYFAPMRFGKPTPSSLRDAWGRIDKAILLFVFGEVTDLKEEEIERYKLVGNEAEVAPTSTLSDWHRKGIQRLFEEIMTREKFMMNRSLEQSSTTLDLKDGRVPQKNFASGKGPIIKRLFLIVLFLLLIGSTFAGIQKAKRMYMLVMELRQNIVEIQTLVASPSLETIKQSGPALADLRNNFDALEQESRSLLWLTPLLKWVPVYGGDLAASRQMLELSDHLLDCAEGAHAAVSPKLKCPFSPKLKCPLRRTRKWSY
jgi:hypothetical protein